MAILFSQGCANDPPKIYPPAPVTPEYSAKLDWAKLRTPVGVDKYSWLVPATSKSTVYIAERNGLISGFKLDGGSSVWQQQTPYRFSAGPTLFNDVLYLGTNKAELIAFDANSGEILWHQQLSSEILVPPQLSTDRIIVRSNDGRVIGLRVKDGKVVWSYDRNVPALSLRGNSTPLIYGESVIAGFANGRLISLSLLDGKTNWETTVSLPKGRTELERMVDIDGPLFEKDGIIYVSAFNGKTAAVNASTGSIFWTRDIASHLGAVADDNNVYLTDVKGQVWALDKNSGSTLWMQNKLEERTNTRPLVHDNKLVIGDALGEIYWLSLTDGRLLGHLPHDKASKLSGATYYVDEIDTDSYFIPRREETAVIFEPKPVNNRLVITYQNGVVASILAAN